MEQVLGWPSGTFLRAYDANVATQHEEALEASLVGMAMRKFMEEHETWTGTATTLLAELNKAVVGTPPREWPKQPKKLGGELTRLAPNLRAVGIYIDREREGGTGQRNIKLRRIAFAEKAGESASPLSRSSPHSQEDVTQPGSDVTQNTEAADTASQTEPSQSDAGDKRDDEEPDFSLL